MLLHRQTDRSVFPRCNFYNFDRLSHRILENVELREESRPSSEKARTYRLRGNCWPVNEKVGKGVSDLVENVLGWQRGLLIAMRARVMYLYNVMSLFL